MGNGIYSVDLPVTINSSFSSYKFVESVLNKTRK